MLDEFKGAYYTWDSFSQDERSSNIFDLDAVNDTLHSDQT